MFEINQKQRKPQDINFCESQKVIKGILKSLVISEFQADEIDGKIYLDNETGQNWEVYEHDDFETYREPFLKGIRRFPHPLLMEIIDITCNSKYEDEIKGACRLLLENECQGIEFRGLLLDEIEKKQINKKRYDLIYDLAELNNTINKIDPLNKNLKDITADHKYFLSLAERALKLKKKLKFIP